MSHSQIQKAMIGFFLVISAIHAVAAYQQYRLIRTSPQAVTQPGEEFADLPPRALGHTVIGYITDLDLSPESINTGNFLSAQYQFAPARLEIGNKNTTFVLIDASTPPAALNLAAEIQANPIFLNSYGKLLAQKP